MTNIIKDLNKNKTYWIVFSIISSFFLISFSFSDIEITTNSSFNLLDSIFSLNFNLKYLPESAFYIPIHLTFGIWNLPLYLISKITDLNIFYFVIVWSKILIIIVYDLIAIIVYKTLEKINVKNLDFWLLILFMSMTIYPAIFDMAQYDCFAIMFGFLGIYDICCEERITNKSLIFFSLSISYKVLFIFVIICALLIFEKRIISNIKNILYISFIPSIFVIFNKYINSIIERNISGLSRHYAYKILDLVIPGGIENISLVFVVIFCIFIYCYQLSVPNNKEQFIYHLSWSSFVIYFSFYIFGIEIHPQWTIFFGLFLVIIIALSGNQKNLLLYEFILEISLIIQHAHKYAHIFFNENRFSNFIYSNINFHILSIDNKLTIGEILETYNLIKYIGIVGALFCATGIMVAILSMESYKNKNKEKCEELDLISINANKIVRLLVLIGYFVVYLLVRFII